MDMSPSDAAGMSQEQKMHASVGMEMWNGQLDYDCAKQAATHAFLFILMFVVVSPAAIIAFYSNDGSFGTNVNGKATSNEEDKKRMTRRKIYKFAAVSILALITFLAFVFGITASTSDMVNAEGEKCYGGSTFAHEGLGWILIVAHMILVSMMIMSISTTDAHERGNTFNMSRSEIMLRLCCERATWVLNNTIKNSVYAFASLSIFLCITGVWTTNQCFSRSTFFSHEIGHIGPASMWMAVALLVIPTAARLHTIASSFSSSSIASTSISLLKLQRKEDTRHALLDLQYREGIMLLILPGIYFIIQTLTGRYHAIFGPIVNENFYNYIGVGTDEKSVEQQEALWHYMKDQQHAFQSLVWIISGVVALSLGKYKYATGVHFVFASMAQTAMIFFHPQINGHATVLHKMHALFLLASSVFRYSSKLLEFSLLATISSALFLSSSSCLTMMAGKSHIDEIGYMLCVIAIASLTWGYYIYLLFDGLLQSSTCTNAKAGKESSKYYDLSTE